MTGRLLTWTHSSCDCRHKTYTRSRRPEFQHGWGRGSPLLDEVLLATDKQWWEGKSVYLWGYIPERLAMFQKMEYPCAHICYTKWIKQMCILMRCICHLSLLKRLILSLKFDTTGGRTPSILFRVGPYFDFIITNAENTALCKDILQDENTMFRQFQKLMEILS